MEQMKVLLTAFRGTSAELLVKGADLYGQFETLLLPNDKVLDSRLLVETLQQGRFEYMFSLGQRPNIKDKVHIETMARKGEAYVLTAFDCGSLKCSLEQMGLPAKLSCNAGTSFCNELYWNGLQFLLENKLETQMVFLHVPFEKNITDVQEFKLRFHRALRHLLSGGERT